MGCGSVEGSQQQLLEGGDGRALERLAAEAVDGADVTSADLEDGVDGPLVEGDGAGPCDAQAVFEVLPSLRAAEQTQHRAVGQAAADGGQLLAFEQLAQPR